MKTPTFAVILMSLLLFTACPPEGCDIDGGGGTPPPAGDAGPCDSRTVSAETWCADASFTPDSGTEAWQHDSTPILVTIQGAANHRGLDVITNPGQEQVLSGKFAYGTFDKDLEGEKVEIWIQVECGRWERFGAALTDSDGKLQFTVPAARRLGAGSYRVKMLVKGDHSAADSWLHVWSPGSRLIVSDIDGTISTQEFDGVWTALNPDIVEARPNALETFQVYASKGYRIIYLTARPEFLTGKTRRWFASRGFPAGVFRLSNSALGVTGDAAITYKGDYLEALATHQGIVFDAGFGNSDTDLAAYLRVLIGGRIALQGFSGDLRGARRFDDWATERDRARCLPPVAQP